MTERTPSGLYRWLVATPSGMLHEQAAMQMATDESMLPHGAQGAGRYTVHPDDTTGTVLGGCRGDRADGRGERAALKTGPVIADKLSNL